MVVHTHTHTHTHTQMDPSLTRLSFFHFLPLLRNEVIKPFSNLFFRNYKKVVMSKSHLLARVFW